MNNTNLNYSRGKEDFIFLPGHPEADSKGFINIHNSTLLNEMAEFILEAKKSVHETEFRNRRKVRTSKF